MKELIEKIPFVSSVAQSIYRKLIKPFPGSRKYWIERYDSGGNSGDGSYNELAEFKAEIINRFILDNNVNTVIEYGCGDGNQLNLAKYPSYIGFDVSPTALRMCREVFSDDLTKSFKEVDSYDNETADITLSLDVIYHLIEDETFIDYMNRLFDSAKNFVIIYSSNTNRNSKDQSPHIKHRKFTTWIDDTKSEWRLLNYIPNKYPYKGDSKTGSFADFYIYKKIEN